MSDLLYFPGCSVKGRAPEFEASTLEVAKLLGVKLIEMPEWNCCGSVLPLVPEKYSQFLAPLRVLARAREATERLGLEPKLVTLCSLCYNTLKLASLAVKADNELATRVSEFIEEELADIEVVHILPVFADALKRLGNHALHPLDMRVAAYYGCRLLRPRPIAIDDPVRPSIFEGILRATSAEVLELPLRAKCCGSFHSATRGELPSATRIISLAVGLGVGLIAVTCPLCHYNLSSACSGGARVAYFTELLLEVFGDDLDG